MDKKGIAQKGKPLARSNGQGNCSYRAPGVNQGLAFPNGEWELPSPAQQD
jgi:hypothetical protein